MGVLDREALMEGMGGREMRWAGEVESEVRALGEAEMEDRGE